MLRNSIFNFTHNNTKTHEQNQLKACQENKKRLVNIKSKLFIHDIQTNVHYMVKKGERESEI